MPTIKKFILPIAGISAIIIAVVFINQYGLFSLLAKLNEADVSLALIFVIGVLAGFHCVGMCGGLVVAYSAKKTDEKNSPVTARPACNSAGTGMKAHIAYNTGRLLSYTIIGAILGGFGAFFGINPNVSGVVLLIASVFMLFMGLSLLTDMKIFKKIRLSTPLFIARWLYGNEDRLNPRGPFFIGLANGLMPCGPLQAMQIYALTSGAALTGALSMAIYALGTIPAMLFLGFIVNSLNRAKIGQIMKYSGVVVIVLALFMFNRALANFGTGFNPDPLPPVNNSANNGQARTVNMKVTYYGYEPNVLYARVGEKVRWVIDGSGITGCTNEIILHDYDIRQKLTKGENVIEFTPRAAGEIKFSCWMQMVWGKFIVTGDEQSSQKKPNDIGLIPGPATEISGASCHGNGEVKTGGCSCGCGSF